MAPAIPLRSGDLVWTKFPFEDDPDQPGLTRHLACVIAVFTRSQARVATSAPIPVKGLVVGVYTSSKIAKFDDAVPVGIIGIGRNQALSLGGQVPFFIDVRKRAFLPYTPAFFPDMHTPSGGVLASSGQRLFDEVKKQYALVNDRHRELIVNLGPLRP